MSFYLVEGHVYHSRRETAKNSFKYPIFNFYFLTSGSGTFINFIKKHSRGIFNLCAKDYLPLIAEGGEIDERIRSFLRDKIGYQPEKIFLQTIPRMFGYAFNPVSFWYCFSGEKLEGVLCEVNNTFGENHCYWLYGYGDDINNRWLVAEKHFHVSPFFTVDGKYLFRFQNRPDSIHVDIQLVSLDGVLKLNTWVSGKIVHLSNVSFFKLFCKYGWMTPMVVFRIHFQAIKLYFKRVKFYKKPDKPVEELTNGQTVNRS